MGGGRQRDGHHARLEREFERRRRHAFPGDAYQTSRGTHDYCGPQESRGKSSVRRRHALGRLSGDACRRDDGLKTTAGGSVSFAPPHTPTPKPSTTSRIGRGGGGYKPAYGTLGRETRRGHWSAGARGLVALRRTDDEGRTMGGIRHWRGAAEYAFMEGEEAKRTKGERRQECSEGQ